MSWPELAEPLWLIGLLVLLATLVWLLLLSPVLDWLARLEERLLLVASSELQLPLLMPVSLLEPSVLRLIGANRWPTVEKCLRLNSLEPVLMLGS